MEYKTPGVYIKEISTFPPSVVAVDTAIPAFIGYTERAETATGDSLSGIPTRVSSLLEFQALYGGPFTPASYLLTVDGAGADAAVTAVTPRDDSDNARRYYLYDSIELFYANGGGACYIVSVGAYPAEIDDAELEDGINAVAKVDEPTLLVFPDAVGLVDGGTGGPGLANFARLQQLALAQCDKLKDRFAILDLIEGYQEDAFPNTPIANFRNGIGTTALLYGAAYYPWVLTAKDIPVSLRSLDFQDTGGLAISDTGLDTLLGAADTNDLLTTLLAKQGDTDTVMGALSTALAGVSLADFSPLRSHFETLVSDFNAPGGGTRANFTAIIRFLSECALAFPALAAASLSTDSVVAARVTQLQADTSLISALADLVSIEKNTAISTDLLVQPPDDPATVYATLVPDWTTGGVNIGAISEDTDISLGAGTIQVRGGRVLEHAKFVRVADKIISVMNTLFNMALDAEEKAETALIAGNTFFKDLADKLRRSMRLLPPSGPVAGIYAAVDRSRGVWKAPANVSVSAIIGPAVKITNEEQAGLNVHSTGKSINAIRSFVGKGTLVWGARTLAGNDNEWRYVPVRRFFNFVEESVKKASEPFVFEPNDANTWVKVRGLIENFLVIQWRQGALAGSKPQDAFFVKVGLGQTMTAQDILEGRLIVEIGMAAVRPAEFIILRFSHKMQES